MNISKDSFFVKLAYTRGIPKEDSICSFVNKLLTSTIKYFACAILIIAAVMTDVVYILLSGKSFLLVHLKKGFPQKENPLISQVPHIWYKGYPIPQLVIYSSLTTWLLYKAVLYVSQTTLSQQSHQHPYIVLCSFMSLIAITGYCYKQNLRKLYAVLWTMTHQGEEKVASGWQVFVVMMQSIKRKTCIKVTFV